jgi:putative oxidoreductase
MSLFSTPSQRQVDAGLTVLRFIVGTIFVAHGAQKLFIYGFAGVTAGFDQMGIPMASVTGPFIGLLEFFGGMALIGGFLTRLVAAGLASTMAVAMAVVHIKAGFFAPNGVEFPLSLFAANLLLVLTGAGAFSIDSRIGAKRSSASVGSERRLRRAA